MAQDSIRSTDKLGSLQVPRLNPPTATMVAALSRTFTGFSLKTCLHVQTHNPHSSQPIHHQVLHWLPSLSPLNKGTLIDGCPKLSTNTACLNCALATAAIVVCQTQTVKWTTTHPSGSKLPACPLPPQHHQLLLLKAWQCLQMFHRHMLSLPSLPLD